MYNLLNLIINYFLAETNTNDDVCNEIMLMLEEN